MGFNQTYKYLAQLEFQKEKWGAESLVKETLAKYFTNVRRDIDNPSLWN